MGLFKKKPTYFEIGRDGTPEELTQANQSLLLCYSKRYGYYGSHEQHELQNGAVQAFKEGRPWNVQAILSNLEEFNVRYRTGYIGERSHVILSEISKGQTDPVAAINLALANTTEFEKRGVLDNSLLLCMEKSSWSDNSWKETLIAPLLAAGANVNFGGMVLATAIKNGQPPYIIQLLQKNDASFDDARAYMQDNGWDERHKKNLDIYHTSAKAEENIVKLKETVAELTRKLADPAPQKKTVAARRAYPSAF